MKWELRVAFAYHFLFFACFIPSATRSSNGKPDSTGGGTRYQYSFESVAKAFHANWWDRFCWSETIAGTVNACDMFGVVTVTVLLSIIQNYRAATPNMQSTHSSGIQSVRFHGLYQFRAIQYTPHPLTHSIPWFCMSRLNGFWIQPPFFIRTSMKLCKGLRTRCKHSNIFEPYSINTKRNWTLFSFRIRDR